ncbi:MAG: cytochrome d ubiquinol oxidase subunit II [Sulfuricurvum sp.]
MFENLTLHELQIYWWSIISLLGGLFVFIMFVQGGQTLLNELSADETEKTMLVNSLGRKWELGFTTLVLFGGALFAAFPLFYATSFGGAYWVWLAILFTFIIQAVSYEYRKKEGNVFGAATYETFLAVNGYAGTFLLGAAISTFFSGAMFSLDDNHFVTWMTSTRGLEALLDWHNYPLPIAMIFLVRIIAGMYFLNNIDHEPVRDRTRAMIKRNILYFLPFFLLFVVWIATKEGASYDPITGVVTMVPMKHLHTFIDLPWIGAMFVIGVVMVLVAVYNSVFRAKNCCIFTVAAGTVLTVMALLLNVGLNATAYYPSNFGMNHSLTIENSSGSHYTLSAMSYASLMVPFVLGYIAYVWYAMDRVKITEEEILSSGEHHY